MWKKITIRLNSAYSLNFPVFCEIPANFTIARVHASAAEIVLDQVFLEPHENYFFGYRVLYKNLDDPNSNWAIKENIRRYLPPNPVEHKISSLKSYTKYSFRVFAASFKSAGLISEAIELRTDESSRWLMIKIFRARKLWNLSFCPIYWTAFPLWTFLSTKHLLGKSSKELLAIYLIDKQKFPRTTC